MNSFSVDFSIEKKSYPDEKNWELKYEWITSVTVTKKS